MRWTKHLSNTVAVVTLGLPSVRYVVLVRKLDLLLKLMDEGADGVEVSVFRSLLDDVSSIGLVRKCRELKEHFGTSVTDSILCWSEMNVRAVMIKLKKIDKKITFKEMFGEGTLFCTHREEC